MRRTHAGDYARNAGENFARLATLLIFPAILAGMRLSDPETAIAAFEQRTGLMVTVHDLRQTLEPLLRTRRYRHRHPLCAAAKSQFDPICQDLDITQVRRDIGRQQEGRIQLCHAGLVEWIVPVFRDLDVEWILFAGVRQPGKDLRPDATNRAPVRRPWGRSTALPAAVSDQEARLILECLRQLAARLWLWRMQWEKAGHMDGTEARGGAVGRPMRIYRFIGEHHTRPITLADLAEALDRSESRASHIVREACGRSFRDLVVDARLRTAMDLLRNSSQNILQVALHSGFDQIAHFHRIFRRRIGCTPREFRLRADG